MSKVSVVINTRNEEKNLPRVLASIKGLADEVIVVDMESTDNTVKIAKKEGAKVFSHKPTGYVEPARNFAISKATGNWILILDADEEVRTQLRNKLRNLVQHPKADFYRLPRKNIIFGKWIEHSRWWPDYNIRFFKKGKVSWSEIIHSVPETKGKGLDLEAREENAIIHYNYNSVSQYIERLNRYTDIQAKLLVDQGYLFDWRDLIQKPTGEFINRFFANEGFKDGVHGLALAFLQAFSELVLYLKIWQAERFEDSNIDVKEVIDTMRETEKEIHYWQANALVREGAGLLERIKRKLRV